MSFPIHVILILVQLILSVDSKVCSSLDVRNTPDHISAFRDCRVIQGHLQLVLMDRWELDDDSDYFNQSFSELYEITDYLIIYRLMGLSSLNTIFPKLTSIKGENLFRGYALVLYELDDLKEIGLTSLRSIERGGIKINSCPNLCYVDTVNWTAIGISHMTYDDRAADCTQEWCPQHCRGNCWNNYECQSFDKTQCDQACIGCTKVRSSEHCSLCKYFNDNGTCVQTCPKLKLIDNSSSKCIQSEECISQKGSIFNNNCVKSCPLWHDRNSTGHCVPSKVKTCLGIRISDIWHLTKMYGCTHINGSLDIAFPNSVDTKILKLYLGSIVSISENLKILRSTGMTTLECFESLSVIKGEKLWATYYSLFIVENQNLQRIFHENTTLVIENGEVLFQNNPYLCPSEYKNFKVNVTAYNNGNETICEPRSLNVTIVRNNPTNVTITWPQIKNITSLLGYTVYYIKIASKNFSLVQVKDGFVDKDGAPEGQGWTSIFVPNNTVLLKRLTPYSNYSYYIKTNMMSETDNLQSPIYSFKTAIGDPSEPLDVELESQTNTTITLKWKAPRYLNGNLTHYKLAVYELEDDEELIRQRNYCVHPLKENSCSCPKPVEVLHQLFLNDTICIGNGDNYCNSQTIYHTEAPTKEPKLRIQKRSLNDSEEISEFTIKVTTSHEQMYMVCGLKPFTLYTLFLRACNDKEDDKENRCGGSEMLSQRTLKTPGADIVSDVNITVSNKSVIVNWTKPKDPNSILLAYNIEYKKRDPKFPLRQKCKTSDQKSQIKISDLDSGKYKLRIQAISLAGSGEIGQWYAFRIGSVSSAKKGNRMNWLYGFLIVMGVAIVMFLGFVTCQRYRKARNADDHVLVYRMRAERDLEEDEWKLDEETVEIIKDLEQNSIGIIYRKKGIGK